MKRETVINPKRDPKATDGRASWYPYYAGFSPQFVSYVLQSSRLLPAALIADPWNGAGTTTTVAQAEGYRTWGGDANPAMVIVARAKQVSARQLAASRGAFEAILASRSCRSSTIHSEDPLLGLLPPGPATEIRSIERSLRNLCAELDSFPEIPEEMKPELALMYLTLFRAARSLAKGSKTTNPTWHKLSSAEFIELSSEAARAEIVSIWKQLSSDVDRSDISLGMGTLSASLSQAIPLKDGVVDLILTSPPYCTRIDYGISTIPELAVLGTGKKSFDLLRRSLMGTTTVEKDIGDIDQRWGASCCTFLDSVRSHPSKASSTYYLKSHVQYFKGLFESIEECQRVLKKGGAAVFVVQDSEYKGIRNDLASITVEMFESLGVRSTGRDDFEKRISMRSLNAGSKMYASGAFPIESVLTFKK
ncbi:DNA methyltransferase [Xanthomonas sp. WHRI 10208]